MLPTMYLFVHPSIHNTHKPIRFSSSSIGSSDNYLFASSVHLIPHSSVNASTHLFFPFSHKHIHQSVHLSILLSLPLTRPPVCSSVYSSFQPTSKSVFVFFHPSILHLCIYHFIHSMTVLPPSPPPQSVYSFTDPFS